MENLIVSKYMRLIEPLSMEAKLELLSKLAENVKTNLADKSPAVDKEKLMEELSGSWKDMDDNIIEEIFRNRANSQKEISLE